MAYGEAARTSKEPEKFGNGAVDGLMAAECANNASTGGSMTILLSLGLPGSNTTAMMIAAFMIHGMQPGPLLLSSRPDIVYGIFVAMLLSNLFLLVLTIMGIRLFLELNRLPYSVFSAAIISPAREPDRDINYTFGAVGIDKAFVDYSANCGNISSAVGPYAVDKGLVKAFETFTVVRIYNTNTKKLIHAKVPVKRGRFTPDGDYAIDGCPGTGARIELSFMDPAGATTGRLFPTGNVVDELTLESGETYTATIVDAGNPTAFIRAEELNLRGDELPAEFDKDMAARAKLEAIRKKVGERMGIPVSESIPKVAFIAAAQDFRTVAGETIRKGSVSLLARVMAMGKMHKTFAITAGIPASIGAVIPGSVVNRVVFGGSPISAKSEIVIGHPSGMMDVKVEARFGNDGPFIVSCTVGRTARRIMDGRVYVSGKVYA